MPTIDQIKQAQRQRYAAAEEAINVRTMWRNSDTNSIEDPDAHLFRPISAIAGASWKDLRRSPTDIPEQLHRRMLQVCLYLYQANPIARMAVNMSRDYIVGQGVKVEAAGGDKRMQWALDAFWHHPSNKMNQRIYFMAQELAVYGELIQRIDFEPTGVMRVKHISPGIVYSLTPDQTDYAHFTQVNLNQEEVEQNTRTELLLPYVDKQGLRQADALYLAVNRVADASRGLSDLLPLVDVLSDIDSFMFLTLQKARHMQQWFWDIKFDGANKEQLDAYADEVLENGTYPGSLRVHNERVTWEAKSAELSTDGVGDVYQMMYALAITGLQIPPHWTGFGGGSSKAGAEASNEPSYQRLMARQNVLKEFIADILDLQIDHLIRIGKLPKTTKQKAYTIHMPPIAIRDMQRMGGATAKSIDAVITARDNDALDPELAKHYVKRLLDTIISQ